MQNIKKPVLEKYFSKSRLEKYQQIAGGGVDFIELYKFNIKCSEKFFTALIQFEVLLRNSVNHQLIENFGKNWFDDKAINFSDKQRDMIHEVKLKLLGDKKEINSCNVTSNLNFGFWTNIFSPHCDKLWKKSLHKIFYNEGSHPSRAKIRERLEILRKLRNRISHCECIIYFPLEKYYCQFIEIVSWINADIAKWLDEEINFSSLNFEKTKNVLRPK